MASALDKARARLADRKKALAAAKAALKKAAAKVAETARTIKRLTTPKPTGLQRTSAQGIDFLIREEGVRNFAYNDPAGHATFGVGHLIHLGRCTPADFATWGSPSHPSPPSRAKTVLAQDIAKYESTVRTSVKRRVTQAQFDAMVSLCFNIGQGGFAGSTVAREARAGHTHAAADAFRKWGNPSILKPRRERERRLFLTGKYR